MEEIIRQIMLNWTSEIEHDGTGNVEWINPKLKPKDIEKFWIESTIKILEGLKKENIYERSGDDIAHGENIQIDLLNYVLDDAIQLLKTFIN